MSDVAFFYTSNDQPLPFDAEEGRFVWRQYHKGRGNWYVRVSDQNIKSVFIRVAEAEFTLAKHTGNQATGNCWILSDDIQQDLAEWIKYETNQEPNPGSWVALLDLWSDDGKGPSQQLDPPLYIEPGNLDPDDFEAIIERLQELAFFRYSPTKIRQEDRGGSTEGGTEDNEDELLKLAADKFLALIKQVQLNWPLVQVTASRETRLLPKLVDVSSAAGFYSSRLAAKVAQQPHARRVEILIPQESFATIENRFLVHALQEVYHRSPVFNGRLIARSNELQAQWKASDDKKTKSKQQISEWQEKQVAELQVAAGLTNLAQNITSAAKAIAPYINDPFLHDVRDHPALPVRATDCLTRSFAYGPIYSAFCDYQNQPGLSFEALKPGMMQALNTKAIHPACTLYELWVFVELYNMLIHAFGFRLPAGATAGHPLDYVDSAMGEIIGDALKGREFRLELRPTNNQHRVIEVSLWYDTAERERHPGTSRLRPDIYLEVTDSKISDRHKPFMFAVDAKYHSYPGFYMRPEREKYGVDTVFDLDLLITAKEKYHGKLGCDAAFVVHSDANERYTYWGGRPYKQGDRWPLDKQGNRWPLDHHYGSVFANPSDTSNLRRVLKCFLMYHIDIESICWSCRREIESREKFYSGPQKHYQYDVNGNKVGVDTVYVEQKLIGREYHCGYCQSLWMRTWCSNDREDKIYKIGLDSFHSRDGSGRMICPTCGDGYTEAKTTA